MFYVFKLLITKITVIIILLILRGGTLVCIARQSHSKLKGLFLLSKFTFNYLNVLNIQNFKYINIILLMILIQLNIISKY